MSSRVIVSEHQTRLKARLSKGVWRRRRERAIAGSTRAAEQLFEAGVPNHAGNFVVEKGSGHEREKWVVLFSPMVAPLPGSRILR